MKNTTNQALMLKLPNMVPTMQQVRKKVFPKSWILGWGITPLLISGLLGCNNLSEYGINAIGVNVTAISELKPQKNNNDTFVYVQGKVERKIPLLEQQMYQIDDTTGKVWVLTDHKGWKLGDKVVVKALPRYESIPISGAELGEIYLEEK